MGRRSDREVLGIGLGAIGGCKLPRRSPTRRTLSQNADFHKHGWSDRLGPWLRRAVELEPDAWGIILRYDDGG